MNLLELIYYRIHFLQLKKKYYIDINNYDFAQNLNVYEYIKHLIISITYIQIQLQLWNIWYFVSIEYQY